MGRVWGTYSQLTRKKNKLGFGLIFSRVPPVSVSVLLDDSKESNAVSQHGFFWFRRTMEAIKFSRTLFERALVLPKDTWTLDTAPFPRVTVRITRMSIKPGRADIVDVVDIGLLSWVITRDGDGGSEAHLEDGAEELWKNLVTPGSWLLGVIPCITVPLLRGWLRPGSGRFQWVG
jgi:hypothetical protein